ncbi:MAG: hypothetical protein EBS65_14055 [Betaproteobacteria bacterium]|nr:hypothetical protein [Betaproteobacteria bacterium]
MSSARTSNSRLVGAGRIDRMRPLDFTFNGRQLQGYAGDTLASALLANGIHLSGNFSRALLASHPGRLLDWRGQLFERQLLPERRVRHRRHQRPRLLHSGRRLL